MTTARRLSAMLAVLLGTGLATGQTGPQLLTVYPPGAKHSRSVEVTFSGSGFDGEEILLFSTKGFQSELLSTAAPTPDPKVKQPGMKAAAPTASVKFKVTPSRDVPSGLHDVRVVSKSGLSNPRTFVVGDYTEVNETEPNNDVGQAQKVELGTTVNGVISTPTDVDYVLFHARAGESIAAYCLTTSIDSRLSADLIVSSVDGKILAANRGYRNGDAVVHFKAPTDGDYLVRVAQFAYTTGGPDHFYRLTLTADPWVDAVFPPLKTADDAEANTLVSRRSIAPSSAMLDARDSSEAGIDGHLVLRSISDVVLDNDKNGTAETPQPVKAPCDIAGKISRKNDRHWYSFQARKGEVWSLEVFADRLGSPIAPYFMLTDDKGKLIARIEDSGESLSPNQFYTKSDDPARYRFVVPADGTYKVMVSSVEAGIQFGPRDQYVLRIAPERPDFRLAIMPLSTHLPDAGTLHRRGAALFAVFAFRFDGFNEEITLSATDLPDGVTCPPQVLSAGQTRGIFVLSASSGAKDWAGFVKVIGTAGKLKHEARPFTVTWTPQGLQANQVPNVPMLTRMDRGPGLALAIRGDAPFVLTPTQKEHKAKAGEKIEVALEVARHDSFKDAIQVYSAVPNFGPKQQGNQPVPPLGTIAVGKTEARVSVDVPANLAPGVYTLVLRGQTSAPAPKGAAAKRVPTYPTLPITVVIEGKMPKK